MRHGIFTCVATVAIFLATGSLSLAQRGPRPSRVGGVVGLPVVPPSAAPAGTSASCNAASPRVGLRPLRESSTNRTIPWRYFPLYYPVMPNYNYTSRYPYRYPVYEAPQSPGETAEHFLLPRASSFDEQAKARELVAKGDASFARRRYVAAIARYKEAVRAAPDVADARIRQALALIAQRKYPAAVKIFFEALDVQEDWSESDQDLVRHGASDRLAKTTKVLTRLVEVDPMNADLALALGIQLFFSGQRERAELYFTRAVQLGADQDNRLAGFLRQTEVAQTPR